MPIRRSRECSPCHLRIRTGSNLTNDHDRLAYFGPLYALINLFIHILQHPELPSAQSDLALMDIGAAHFARLEFATDAEISMAFVKEIAALARTAVRRAKTLPPRSIDGSLGVRGGDPLAQPPRHTPGAIPEQIDIDGFEGNKDVRSSRDTTFFSLFPPFENIDKTHLTMGSRQISLTSSWKTGAPFFQWMGLVIL